MEMRFELDGGHVEVEKRTFMKEMLRPQSLLKRIVVLSENGEDFKPPLIDKVSKPGWVIVRYNTCSQIELGEFYADFVKALKESLGDRITGRLTMRITTFNTFYEVIDLN